VTATQESHAPDKHSTVLVLMKSPEADATIDALAESDPGVSATDMGSYWKLTSAGDIRVEMSEVSAELGEPVSLARWLVVMSSYVGRIETGDDHLTVTAGLPDIGS
jgi:hypothetical protein